MSRSIIIITPIDDAVITGNLNADGFVRPPNQTVVLTLLKGSTVVAGPEDVVPDMAGHWTKMYALQSGVYTLIAEQKNLTTIAHSVDFHGVSMLRERGPVAKEKAKA